MLGQPNINPVITAFTRVENVLDMATQPDLLLNILKEIRKADTKAIKFIRGYAGASRAVRAE
jgi:hypothetical protein